MGRGTLKFKGDDGPKHKKKETKSKIDKDATAGGNSLSVAAASSGAATAAASAPAAAAAAPAIMAGSGRITTSGTVVSGYETKFGKEVRVGDALLIGSVMRVVTIVLSELSMNLSSAFPSDFKEPTKYSYVTKPRNQELDEKVMELKQKKAEAETSEHAFAGYAGSQVVYRERTAHGSYRTKRAGTADNLTRSDLLEIRAKKTSDKYC
jgi:biotin carboxyl carrier protein